MEVKRSVQERVTILLWVCLLVLNDSLVDVRFPERCSGNAAEWLVCKKESAQDQYQHAYKDTQSRILQTGQQKFYHTLMRHHQHHFTHVLTTVLSRHVLRLRFQQV